MGENGGKSIVKFLDFLLLELRGKVGIDVCRHRVICPMPRPERNDFPRDSAFLRPRDKRMAQLVQVMGGTPCFESSGEPVRVEGFQRFEILFKIRQQPTKARGYRNQLGFFFSSGSLLRRDNFDPDPLDHFGGRKL